MPNQNLSQKRTDNNWQNTKSQTNLNNHSNRNFFPSKQKNNNAHYSKNKHWNKNRKYNNKRSSFVNSVNFRLKNIPDEERNVYSFKKIKPPQKRRRKGDRLFLQQYQRNSRTKSFIYIKPATKHNLLYPFNVELDLVREYINKR